MLLEQWTKIAFQHPASPVIAIRARHPVAGLGTQHLHVVLGEHVDFFSQSFMRSHRCMSSISFSAQARANSGLLISCSISITGCVLLFLIAPNNALSATSS